MMITIEPPSSVQPLIGAAGETAGRADGRAARDEASQSHALQSKGAALRRSLRPFLRRAAEHVGLRGEVSVLLTDDRTMRRLNRSFRGKNKSTDVLSFPAAAAMDGMPEIAGDLAISVPIAAAQAERYGHAVGTELRILMLHGLLHLHGMDHETDTGAMREREAELRRVLRLPVGLIGRTEEQAAGRPERRRR